MVSSLEEKIIEQQKAIARSVRAINHHSDTIAKNTEALKEFAIKHSAVTSQEHKQIFEVLSENKEYMFKYVIFPLIVIIGGLVGIKLFVP